MKSASNERTRNIIRNTKEQRKRKDKKLSLY
jgi:hypothetical protein